MKHKFISVFCFVSKLCEVECSHYFEAISTIEEDWYTDPKKKSESFGAILKMFLTVALVDYN